MVAVAGLAAGCGDGQICSGGKCADGSAAGGGGVTGAGGSTASGLTLVTSAPSAYWQTGGQVTELATGNADVTINDAAMAQTWEGFGGAFNEMGWSYLSMLSEGDRANALRLLFGADGARFAFGRIPIGASDYAMSRYTLAETPGDTALASFSIDRDLDKLIPFVRAA